MPAQRAGSTHDLARIRDHRRREDPDPGDGSLSASWAPRT
jgi:hypothetical protein